MQQQINIKVVIRDGIAEAALCDRWLPICVEIVDINDDFADYKELKEYAESLYNDPGYAEIQMTIADFTETE